MADRPELVVAGGKHWYAYQDTLYPSVTGILKALPKPALINWAANTTAQWAIDNLPTLWSVAQPAKNDAGDWDGYKGSPDAAVEMLKRARFQSRDAAGKVGTIAHAAILMGGEITPEIEPHMAQWKTWAEPNGLVFVAAEFPVVSPKYGYGGTVDLVADFTAGEWEGRRMLLDVKTGKGVYDETELQLAAYRHAEIGLPSDIDGVAAIHLRPDFCKPIPYAADEAAFVTFRAVRRTAEWLGMLRQPDMSEPENGGF